METFQEILSECWIRIKYGRKVNAARAVIMKSPRGYKNVWGKLRVIGYILGMLLLIGLYSERTADFPKLKYVLYSLYYDVDWTEVFLMEWITFTMIWSVLNCMILVGYIRFFSTRRFRLEENIDAEEMYNVMKPIFETKYPDMNIKVDQETSTGFMTVNIGGNIYRIRMEGNSTFMVFCKEFAYFIISYKTYKNMNRDVGLISYEIQYAFNTH